LAVAIKEDERDAVGFRKFGQRVAHERGLLFGGGGFVRGGRAIAERQRFIERLVAAGSPQVRERGVARDLPEPGTQLLGLAQIRKFAPGGEEGFLRGILTGGEVAEDSKGDAANHCLVASHDLDERPLVPTAGRADQFCVRSTACPRFAPLFVSPKNHLFRS
jgi:hypothetical protein